MSLEDITQRRKAILGFLYASSQEPVDKIHLMKEVFWLSEHSDEFKQLLENFGPYDFGPDDQDLEADVEDLIAFGYVDLVESREKKYRLTDDGSKIIKKIFNEQELLRFESIKQTLNKLNFEELLFLVYKKFPDYAVNSVAKSVLHKENEIISRLISKGAISQAYAAKLLGVTIQEVQRIGKSRC